MQEHFVFSLREATGAKSMTINADLDSFIGRGDKEESILPAENRRR